MLPRKAQTEAGSVNPVSLAPASTLAWHLNGDTGGVASRNLELVRSICEAWERGEFGAVDWAHPDIEYVLAGDRPTSDSWTGVVGMAEGWTDWLKTWQEFRAEAEEYRELDEERILVFHRLSGRGKTSGLDLAQAQAQGAALFHLSDGRVTRLAIYRERDQALADLGLGPESAAAGS
jgi:ketosteroid isomerase-like protein